MRTTLAASLMLLLAGCAAHSPPAGGAAVTPVRSPGSVHYEPPPTRPPRPGAGAFHPAVPAGPARVAHPQLPLDGPGAAAVAQSFAWERGYRTEVEKVEREGDEYRVAMRLHGEWQGRMELAVHAFSGAVSVRGEEVRPDGRAQP
jgi:hypothetical protein